MTDGFGDAMSDVPKGWAACEGQVLPIEPEAELFELIDRVPALPAHGASGGAVSRVAKPDWLGPAMRCPRRRPSRASVPSAGGVNADAAIPPDALARTWRRTASRRAGRSARS